MGEREGYGGGTGGEVDMRLLCAPVALVTGYGLVVCALY